MAITQVAAWWFLPFVLPICVWVAWNDMAFMKIPNKAVLAMGAVFLAVGLIALPLAEYPWRLLHILVVLVIGFALNMAGLIGAGDAKFAAVMAPFIPLGDLRLFMVLFVAVMVVSVVTHKLAKRIPAVRNLTPGWKSWAVAKFPMGLALGSSLIFYLALGTQYGQ